MYYDVLRFTRSVHVNIFSIINYNNTIHVDIDIQQCISEAVHKYQITPPSLCVRKHEKISSQSSLIPQEAVSYLLIKSCIIVHLMCINS